MKEAQAVRDELKIDLATKEESLIERINAANQELEKLTAIHKETGKDVPNRILERYEFIHRRLEHPVIVPVKTASAPAAILPFHRKLSLKSSAVNKYGAARTASA